MSTISISKSLIYGFWQFLIVIFSIGNSDCYTRMWQSPFHFILYIMSNVTQCTIQYIRYVVFNKNAGIFCDIIYLKFHSLKPLIKRRTGLIVFPIVCIWYHSKRTDTYDQFEIWFLSRLTTCRVLFKKKIHYLGIVM